MNIDRMILNRIGDYNISWTKMDKISYPQVIEKIKLIKKVRVSIAEWELNIFNRR